ncbi:MAG: class I SAM-dependent methyltransferase [Dehalococcoidia bacterium]|nr:class I SAM-dependent methyltransferase [Dehalococcoidia bacterium]
METVEKESGRYSRVGMIDTRVCRFNPEDVVLDAGTGGGHLLKTLSSRCKAVYATDINSGFLRRVRRGISEPNVAVAQADVTRMPFKSSCFSKVVCSEVLEHLTDPSNAIAELHRVLRPNGTLVVAVPTYFSEKLYSRLNRKYDQNQGEHVTILQRDDWIRRFRQAHLQLFAVRNENFVPALYWTFRNVFPIRYDSSSGRVLETRLSDRLFFVATSVLNKATFGGFSQLGNVVFAKSWYFYLVKERGAS